MKKILDISVSKILMSGKQFERIVFISLKNFLLIDRLRAVAEDGKVKSLGKAMSYRF